MAKNKKMKIVKRSLAVPMSEHDFQQLTLTANLLAVCKRLINRETDAERKAAYSLLMRDTRRIESSIIGYLDPEIANEKSNRFYLDMEQAVVRFLDSFQYTGLLGRDEKGRFIKLKREVQ